MATFTAVKNRGGGRGALGGVLDVYKRQGGAQGGAEKRDEQPPSYCQFHSNSLLFFVCRDKFSFC